MAAPAATAATASDGSSARGEKERGNRAFASGQHEAALEAYAAALAAVGQGEGKEDRELRATLHSNRAACHLQLKRFGECIEVRAWGKGRIRMASIHRSERSRTSS